MNKWANHLWQCEMCSDILTYTDIYQQAAVGLVLCKDCYDLYAIAGEIRQDPARLCDECGKGIAFSAIEEATDWSGAGTRVDVCTSCSVELPPDEEDKAIFGLMRLLEDLDSKNATGDEDES